MDPRLAHRFKPPKDLLSTSFPAQIRMIQDKSQRKAVLCSRRGGKTHGVSLLMCLTALAYPRCTIVYLTLTAGTAKKILLKDILTPINDQYDLNMTFKLSSPAEVHFPNGSIIYLVGIDSKEKEKKKLLGQANKLVIIDEAQDITINLEQLIKQIITPTLWKSKGQIIMLGTPSDYLLSYFYQITKDYQSNNGWSYHSWLASDNPHMREEYLQAIEYEKQNDPNIEETPWFQQTYLGRWVIDTSAKVYHYYSYNLISSLPPDNYTYLLGVDLGYNDPDGFVVIAHSHNKKLLFVVEAFTQKGNTDLQTGETIISLTKKYPIQKIIVDGSSLKSVETMRQHFGLSLIAADRGTKADYIRLLNRDMHANRIKILPAANVLLSEMDQLIWDKNKPGKEKEGLSNHSTDAFLYAWKHSNFWQTFEPQIKPKLTDEEIYLKQLEGELYPPTIFSELERRYDEF